MTEHFDASTFILAERSQTLAPACEDFAAGFSERKPTEICHFADAKEQTLATIATLAPPRAETTPWDDALIPWAEGPRPPFVKPEVWDELTNEAIVIARKWGSTAIAAGWSSLDLFGCYRRPWCHRLDCNGLVASIVGLLTPVRLTAITGEHADLTTSNGDVMRFRRSLRTDLPCSVHLWEAYAMTTGP